MLNLSSGENEQVPQGERAFSDKRLYGWGSVSSVLKCPAGRKWLGKRGGRLRPLRVIRGEKLVMLQVLETVGDP